MTHFGYSSIPHEWTLFKTKQTIETVKQSHETHIYKYKHKYK